jgi:23S rRNA (uracil1939-C5)-methyltransferase
MARKKTFILENVAIVDMGAKGKAVGKKDGQVVFVAGAVPGDVCNVLVLRKRKGYLEGNVHSFEAKSRNRTTPLCTHFGTCGGCKWQNLDYEAQIQLKENQVDQTIKKIAGIEAAKKLPILGADPIYNYRNKLEFTFTNNRWLTQDEIKHSPDGLDRSGVGFHIPGFWDKVLDIQECHLQADPSNAIRNWFRDYATSHGHSFYDIREKSGFLRTLMIRTSSTGEVMVVVQFGEDDQAAIKHICEALVAEFRQITSLQYAINTKQNDSIYDLEIKLAAGRSFIIEEMPAYYAGASPLKFRIGPKSFYQTNSRQAFQLYTIALDFADLTGGENVYDLYTGTGTIALFMAQRAKSVVGIESVPEAIADAQLNARENGVKNAQFVVGDMKEVFTDEFISTYGAPDVVVADPPRDGMHPRVVRQLVKLKAPRMVYISCNPATQARDLNELKSAYRLVKSRAVDMFPHTHHIENVVLLELDEPV